MINAIVANFSLILRAILSGFLLLLGPFLALLVRLGNANAGIIITIGIIFEVIGLGGFWLVIRKDYLAGEKEEEGKEAPLKKSQSKLPDSKSEESQE